MNQNKVHIIDDDEEETNNFPVIDTITDHNLIHSKPIIKIVKNIEIPIQRELSSRIRNAPNRLNL